MNISNTKICDSTLELMCLTPSLIYLRKLDMGNCKLLTPAGLLHFFQYFQGN